MKKYTGVISILLTFLSVSAMNAQNPVKIAVAGISHGHASWIFNRKGKTDIDVIGVYEKDTTLVRKFREKYGLPAELFYSDLDQMLSRLKPQAVAAFGPINEHIDVVRAAAPKNIHVMVEKPLATTLADAREIAALAEKHKTKVLTNFETSWYSSNQYVYDLYQQGELGEIRKVIVNDGHAGPSAMAKEFISWLTDPVQNGAGALFDFGCYGANLMTWLLKGKRPISVTAVTNQNRPDLYPKVDDDATIVLQYPQAQCIIQASWSWSFSRKDMEVYGTKGYAVAVDRYTVRNRLSAGHPEQTIKVPALPAPFEDPFSVLAQVVNGTLKMDLHDRYELPLNVTTVEILEAARQSAQSGKTIVLP